MLHSDKTLFEEISDAYPYLNNTEIRNTLAAFLFTGEDVFKRIKELSGGEPNTTNNRMELTAFIEALRQLKEPCEVRLCSDSQYVINGLQKGWAKNWQRRGWKKADGSPALNPDLWAQALEQEARHKITYVWVKGHAGHPENERCDQLAVAQSKAHGGRQGT